jgi:uncharacterized protein (UPF0276 family)
VAQVHVAGQHVRDGRVIDTHGAPVGRPVLDLLRWLLARIRRPIPVLLERDTELPGLDELLRERAAIQEVYDEALGRPPHA